MGWQIAPELSGAEMKELLFASAYGDARQIDPPMFIETVKAKAGTTPKSVNGPRLSSSRNRGRRRYGDRDRMQSFEN